MSFVQRTVSNMNGLRRGWRRLVIRTLSMCEKCTRLEGLLVIWRSTCPSRCRRSLRWSDWGLSGGGHVHVIGRVLDRCGLPTRYLVNGLRWASLKVIQHFGVMLLIVVLRLLLVFVLVVISHESAAMKRLIRGLLEYLRG